MREFAACAVHFISGLSLDHEGFYQPLKALLQHYVNTGMLSEETMSRIVFAETPDQLLDMIEY